MRSLLWVCSRFFYYKVAQNAIRTWQVKRVILSSGQMFTFGSVVRYFFYFPSINTRGKCSELCCGFGYFSRIRIRYSYLHFKVFFLTANHDSGYSENLVPDPSYSRRYGFGCGSMRIQGPWYLLQMNGWWRGPGPKSTIKRVFWSGHDRYIVKNLHRVSFLRTVNLITREREFFFSRLVPACKQSCTPAGI